jgi:hypothetical protein
MTAPRPITIEPMPPRPRRPAPHGWALVAWAALAIAIVVAAALAYRGTGEDGIRLVIRATARTSGMLFLLAFTASALARRWPGAATRWLLANRRYVGVSFALSHFTHLGAILALAGWSPSRLVEAADTTTLVLGGLGYALLAAMTVTSFDATAAWLGPTAWRRLHTTGAYYLWFVFVATFGGGAAASLAQGAAAPLQLTFTVLLLAALALRRGARS